MAIALSGARWTLFEKVALVLLILALLVFGIMDGDKFKCHRTSATAPMHCDPF
jgi:hypothetical protein